MSTNNQIIEFIPQSAAFLRGSREFYRPLDANKREIRLLTLLPGLPEDPIRVKLSTVSLYAKPHYEALSYTWGDMTALTEIIVEDLKYRVTVNQFDALHNLRGQSERPPLWMDVICIDQAVDADKAQQVAMMSKIYGLSSRTRIWLHLTENHEMVQTAVFTTAFTNTWSAISRLEAAGKLRHTVVPDSIRRRWGQYQGDLERQAFLILEFLAEGVHPNSMPFWFRNSEGEVQLDRDWILAIVMICWMMGASWWKRAWVIQEAIFSPNPALIQVGQHSIMLDTILKAGDCLADHIRLGGDRIEDAWCGFLMTEIHHALIASLSKFKTVYRQHNDGGIQRYWLMRLIVERRATRPHDLIYSTIPLLEEANVDTSEITIDYGLPVANVYAAMTVSQMIEDVNILFEACCLHTKLELPSWVRDWSCPPDEANTHDVHMFPITETSVMLNRYRFHRPNISWIKSDNSLELMVHDVGRLDDVSEPYTVCEPQTAIGGILPDATADRAASTATLRQWRSFYYRHKPRTDFSTAEYWRLILKNKSDFCTSARHLTRFESWLGGIKHTPRTHHVAPQSMDYLLHSAESDGFIQGVLNTYNSHARMFSLNTGSILGIGPNDVVAGDIVVCIGGCLHAMILRPVRDDDPKLKSYPSSTLRTYRMVGPCYAPEIDPTIHSRDEFNRKVRII